MCCKVLSESYNVTAHFGKVNSIRITPVNNQRGPDMQFPGGLAGSEGETGTLGGMSLPHNLKQSTVYILLSTELLMNSRKQLILGQRKQCHRYQLGTDTQAVTVDKQKTALIFSRHLKHLMRIEASRCTVLGLQWTCGGACENPGQMNIQDPRFGTMEHSFRNHVLVTLRGSIEVNWGCPHEP